MTIRGTIFLLVLYILLVWVLVFLFFGQAGEEQVVRQGLLWTAAGIGALLAWLIFERILGWWRLRRARAKAKPAPAQPVAPRPLHDDDAALISLIAEADNRLAQAPGSAGQVRRVADLPLYLLLGPQGSGKTALMQNAGIDAVLLAGQVLGGGPASAPTRVANLWLANDTVFLEIGGRVLESDVARFAEFLRVLAPPVSANGWKIWRAPSRPVQLKGALLVYDAHVFATNVDIARIEQNARVIRDRLQQVAACFGRPCPVYTIFTKMDGIPYFPEFFARLPEADWNQVFGVLTPSESDGRQDRAWADEETKRLTQLFGSLFLSLNARRLLALTHEADASKKPAIYEFPREFKRIRGPLVQFLIDAFRPDPLKLNPMLRGFFFVGTKKTEGRADIPAEQTFQRVRPDQGSFEPTRIFRPDATHVFGATISGPRGQAGRFVDKWLFTTDIFQEVLRKDRPPVKAAVVADTQVVRYRRIAAGVAIGLAGLLIVAWVTSLFENRSLVSDVQEGIRSAQSNARDLSLGSLQSLDNLRHINLDLDQSLPWRYHWGLYTGEPLSQYARRAYFERLKVLVLDDANNRLREQLRGAGQDAGSGTPDDIYKRLKTHRTIASNSCPVDPPLVTGTLMGTVVERNPDLDDARKGLIKDQLDYYSAALKVSNPVKLSTDPEAVVAAREYLQNAHGPEQIYSGLIAEVRKSAKGTVVAQKTGEYKDTISAPGEVAFEFTKEGRDRFEQLAGSGKLQTGGEECVVGSSGSVKGVVGNITQVKSVKALYYRRYADAWRTFLNSCSVKQYRDAPDAVAKLDQLSGSESPLLGIIKFTADNTYFPVKTPQNSGVADAIQKVPIFGKLGKKATEAEQKAKSLEAPEFSTADVMRMFQPAQFVAQPEANVLVNDRNKAYIGALRTLQVSIDKYVRAPDAEKAAAVQQTQDAIQQATTAEKGLTDNFRQDTDGVNDRVAELLEQPIRFARGVIVDPGKLALGKKERERIDLCRAVGPTLAKYPFRPTASSSEANLSELTNVFAPGTGEIWKYQQKSLGELTVRNGTQWGQRPDAPKPRVAPEMLAFLTRAQQVTDVFFPGGSQQPRLQYTLRPVPKQDVNIKLEIDGTVMDSKESVMQKTFEWPARSPASPGANGYEIGGPIVTGFGKNSGLWGVFRLFQHADERALNTREVVWSKQYGEHGEAQVLTPPAKVEFVQFPGGVDVFNPRFFAGLGCPGKAVVEE
jgi:type VI secretion system protein ImpL